MKRFRARLTSLLLALPIVLGLLVPSLAFGCAPAGIGSNGSLSGAVCDCCPKGLPAVGSACTTLCQAGPSAHAPLPTPHATTTKWFAGLARHPQGIDTIPEAPPPR